MNSQFVHLNTPLNFNQLIELIKQLPYKEKVKLTEVLQNETKQSQHEDKVLTHYASESVLSKDWLLQEEEEAWKDL